ncbi:hypothetical protein BOTBODRAFT_123982 [Botryobasidium botryosum FD-172 SS1]|uniref:Cupin type-2 domain-containing protein n=1 Tax=Botryobasidium botryosum (strain FD-172 SS1) TaxID=930990 RepID=A0A067MXT4_BOTB1|nr:hypothetical protein BOTBODRAFT_123982 [Botryobasidium botryosum FD-172 SS1]
MANTMPSLPKTIPIGKDHTMTFLDDPYWVMRVHIQGNDDIADIPPHWHDTHDEVFRVIKGQIQYTINGVAKTYSPDDGEILIPRRVVHSVKSFEGVEVIFEKGIRPMDNTKELFFRNLFAQGKLETRLLPMAQIGSHFDMYPSLPGNLRWLEKGLFIVLGKIAGTIGYSLAYKDASTRDA